MACVRLFSSKELPDGTKVMRLEVMGSPHLRPNDLLSLAAQQVTLTIHKNGRIQPEIHWRDESFPSFYPFLEWPSRKVATWHEVVSQANYVSDDMSARRWYAYDRHHQNVLWENWFIGPSLNQGFRIIRHWMTNTEVEGELNIS